MRGSKQIGEFFRRVRIHSGVTPSNKNDTFPSLLDFASAMGVESSHLGRVEKGERMPGPDYLARLLPFVTKAQENPRALLYAWLEAQGLEDYVDVIRRRE